MANSNINYLLLVTCTIAFAISDHEEAGSQDTVLKNLIDIQAENLKKKNIKYNPINKNPLKKIFIHTNQFDSKTHSSLNRKHKPLNSISILAPIDKEQNNYKHKENTNCNDHTISRDQHSEFFRQMSSSDYDTIHFKPHERHDYLDISPPSKNHHTNEKTETYDE